jgi:hypothetical protein
MNCDYVINNSFISSTHEKTTFCASRNLISINKPIYRIPLHIFSAIYLCAWRDSESSIVPIAVRRITCGIALAALAILGLIDTIVRIVSAIFILAIKQSRNPSKACLVDAFFGFSQSIHFFTYLQLENFFEKNLLHHIIST